MRWISDIQSSNLDDSLKLKSNKKTSKNKKKKTKNKRKPTRSTQRAQTSTEYQHNRIAEWFCNAN